MSDKNRGEINKIYFLKKEGKKDPNIFEKRNKIIVKTQSEGIIKNL